MDSRSTMLKVAYLKGLEQAAEKHAHELGLESEMVKEALIGELAKGALKWGIGKPVGAVAKMLGRQTARVGQRAYGALATRARTLAPRAEKMLYTPAVRAAPEAGAKATGLRKLLGMAPKGKLLERSRGVVPELGRFGKNMVVGAKSPGEMSKLYKALTLGGRDVPSQMLQYGAFSGAMGGLTGGKPGEGWSWEGAGKGFLGGAAGGLGWAAGGRLVRGGLGKLMATKPFQAGRLAGFANRAKKVTGIGAKGPSFWGKRVWDKAPTKGFGAIWKGTPTGGGGQSVLRGLGSKAKDVGIKAGLGVPALGGALAASIGAEEGARRLMGDEQSSLSPQSMGVRGTYAMTPQGRRAVGYY